MRFKLLAVALVGVAIGVLLINSGSASAQLENSPWPMFRGNMQHTGRSPYDTSHVDGTEKWHFTTGDGIESSPAIGSDGTIYVGSWDNNLYAINPDGTEKWHFTTGGWVRSSPAIGSDGTIYVGSSENNMLMFGMTFEYGIPNLYAINPDGTEKWHFLPGGYVCGTFASPTIGSDGTIYYGSGGSIVGDPSGKLWAINPDGTEKWHFTTQGGMVCAPAIGADGTIYFSCGDHNLYAANPDGTKKWHFTTGNLMESSPAIGADGTIYVGSGDHNLYAVNPNGTEKWHFTARDKVMSSPAIGADGTIYVGTGEEGNDNSLYAINQDGTEKWRFNTGGNVYPSPVIGADGTIYVGTYVPDQPSFYAINPDGTEKWRFNTEGGVVADGAIGADGTIYIGSWSYKLYAIDGPSAHENLPADIDNDGMPDNWESQHGLDPNINDASQDKDGDSYTNLEEYQAGTDPTLASSHPPPAEEGEPSADIDNDEMLDTWEDQYGLNPDDPADATLDSDGDGYTNLQEYQSGTNPTLASSYPGAGEEEGVTPPAEGIPIIYVIAGVAVIVVVAGVALVIRRR